MCATKFPQLYHVDDDDDSSGDQSMAVVESATNVPSVGIGKLIGAVKLPSKNKMMSNVFAATTAWVIEEINY